MGISERKEREKIARRNKILEIAEKRFRSKGYESTAMSEIAEELELSPSTLYNYFPNKELLHTFVSLRIFRRMLEKITVTANKDHLSPLEKIEIIKSIMKYYYKSDKEILLNVFKFEASLPDNVSLMSKEIRRELKEFTKPAVNAIASIFSEGIEKGVFKEQKPIVYTDILWSLFSGLVMWEESKKALSPDKDYLIETLDLGFKIFERGILLEENRGQL